MVEYRSSMVSEKEVQGYVVFYTYLNKMILGIAAMILAILCFIFGSVFNIGFLTFLGVALSIFAFYIFYYWLNRVQARRRSLNRLYATHSVISFTYRLSENDGVITDYCLETRSQISFRKTEIEKIFYTKNAILVKLFSGSFASFPRQKNIVEMLTRK